MSYLDDYKLTCPHCKYSGPGSFFAPSCADECFCPNCGEDFIVDSLDGEPDRLKVKQTQPEPIFHEDKQSDD